jgi:hypothetical protein
VSVAASPLRVEVEARAAGFDKAHLERILRSQLQLVYRALVD